MIEGGHKIILYCERALSAASDGLLAEPFNVISNGAYCAVAYVTLRWARNWRTRVLGWLALAVGVGSTIFHLFAERWALIADVVPIVAFMVVAWWLAVKALPGRRAAWLTGAVLVITVAFATINAAVCPMPGAVLFGSTAQPAICFGGGLPYFAAVLALVMASIAMRLAPLGQASDYGIAAAILAVSLTVRASDPVVCPFASVGGFYLTPHVAWHLGTALAMLLVVRAEHRRTGREDVNNVGIVARRSWLVTLRQR